MEKLQNNANKLGQLPSFENVRFLFRFGGIKFNQMAGQTRHNFAKCSLTFLNKLCSPDAVVWTMERSFHQLVTHFGVIQASQKYFNS